MKLFRGPYAAFLAASALAVLPGLTLARLVCEGGSGAAPARLEPCRSYLVAVSEQAYAQPAWRQAAEALREKYEAELVTFPTGRPQAALEPLRRIFPNYVCFVATPEECGRAFVVALHRLTRQLDDDPYGDVLWGILTGYEAADALRMARLSQPLIIRRGATSMGKGLLERLESGFASNEDNVSDFWTKAAGATAVVHQAVSPDAARALAEGFSAFQPDVFYTSGHATERDWQIAYNLPGGAFTCEQGALYARSTDGRRYPVTAPHTKVYLPEGNCLIGHIDRRDCMATAWLHSGGIGQMYGYTAVTFYGYMGWGTALLFEDGRLSLSEAFFLNNQALLHQLATRFPHLLAAAPESYGNRDVQRVAERFARGDRDALGLLWDRDTVAFYGDPAWVARYPPRASSASFRLEEEGGLWTLVVTDLKEGARGDPKWGARPLMIVFPERLSEIRNVACDAPLPPVVTDRFMLVPLSDTGAPGKQVRVTFNARPVPAK